MKRKRPLKKVFRLGLILVVGLLALLVIIGFTLGPALVAQRLNPVGATALESLNAKSQSFHESLTIADLHADSLLWGRDLSQRANYGHVDVPRLIAGNVALQAFTVVTKVPTTLKLEGNNDRSDDITKLAILQRWPIPAWFSLIERALYQAKQVKTLEQTSAGQFRILKTRQDLDNYLVQRQQNPAITAGLLGLEGAQALEGRLENLDRLYAAGFRVIGLAHFFDNEVSGSAHGITRGGLTPLGHQVLERMTKLNLIVDLAHASAQTIDQVLQTTHRPILVSHTGVQGTCKNARNLTDRQLEQIAKSGGVIGIGFWKTAICGDDVSAIVRAIRYATNQIGVDHVALGSDFDGAVRVPFDAANINQITLGLQNGGFTDSEIAKIMGLNVIRLLRQSLPA
jgi:microsomal dipeptidase-like Zn-dependent dipeptidase